MLGRLSNLVIVHNKMNPRDCYLDADAMIEEGKK